MHTPREGDVSTVRRTFSTEEVAEFVALSGDDQPRHTEPDADGRVMVPGLMTATLPTSVGGDQEVLAREMTFSFHRPVYTGDEIVCEVTTETVDEREDRYELVASFECRHGEDGSVVLTGRFDGLIRTE